MEPLRRCPLITRRISSPFRKSIFGFLFELLLLLLYPISFFFCAKGCAIMLYLLKITDYYSMSSKGILNETKK